MDEDLELFFRGVYDAVHNIAKDRQYAKASKRVLEAEKRLREAGMSQGKVREQFEYALALASGWA